MTITIPLWLPAIYLLIGLVVWLPMEYVVWRGIHNPPPFWSDLAKGIIHKPWMPVLFLVVWPYAVIVTIKPKVRKWKR